MQPVSNKVSAAASPRDRMSIHGGCRIAYESPMRAPTPFVSTAHPRPGSAVQRPLLTRRPRRQLVGQVDLLRAGLGAGLPPQSMPGRLDVGSWSLCGIIRSCSGRCTRRFRGAAGPWGPRPRGSASRCHRRWLDPFRARARWLRGRCTIARLRASAFGPKLTSAPKSQARVHVSSADRRHRCSSRSGCSHGGTADLDVGRGIVVDDGDT